MCLESHSQEEEEVGHQARIVILWRGVPVVIRSTDHLSLQLRGPGMVQGEMMVAWAKEVYWKK